MWCVAPASKIQKVGEMEKFEQELHYIEIENKFGYNRFSNSLFTKNKEKIMHYVSLIWIPLLISKVSQQFLNRF